MLDMTDSIAPRSDQMNSDDLMSGPRTFTIKAVQKGASPEQPVDVHLAEFPEGRPFKPSKSMRRVMVAAWGVDAAAYVGKRFTLYRDPEITFGRDKVGGIRISHMSGISKPLNLALTVTKGKRAPYIVQPLPDEAPAVDLITAGQLAELGRLLKEAGITDRDTGLAYMTQVVGRDVPTSKNLTGAEALQVIASFTAADK